MARLTKEELRHDPFLDTTARVTAYLQKNFMAILVGVAAVAVVVVVAVFIQQSRQSSQVQAARAYFSASSAYANGQYNEALLEVEELLGRFAGTEEGQAALYLAGASHLALGEHEEAMGRFRSYLEEAPDGQYATSSRMGLALAHEGLGELELAVEQFRAVREGVPPDAPAAVQAALGEARVLQELGRSDEAITALTPLTDVEDFSSRQEIQNRLDTLEALR